MVCVCVLAVLYVFWILGFIFLGLSSSAWSPSSDTVRMCSLFTRGLQSHFSHMESRGLWRQGVPLFEWLRSYIQIALFFFFFFWLHIVAVLKDLRITPACLWCDYGVVLLAEVILLSLIPAGRSHNAFVVLLCSNGKGRELLGRLYGFLTIKVFQHNRPLLLFMYCTVALLAYKPRCLAPYHWLVF